MQGDNKGFWVCKKKMGTGGESLCRFQHPAFREFYDLVMNMKFEENPEYGRLISMFEPIVNNVQRPLAIDSALKVSSPSPPLCPPSQSMTLE